MWLALAAGCGRETADHGGQGPATAPDEASRGTVVARLGGSSVTIDEADRPIAGALFELDYERYLLRRQSLEGYLLQKLGERGSQTRAAHILIEPPLAPVTDLPGSPAALRPDRAAEVTVTVFCDFASPHCAQAQSTLADLVVLYPQSVRIAARDLPLALHPDAGLAAEAARCAGKQGRYWTYHDLLWARGPDLSRDSLDATARAAGLDATEFARCVDRHETAADVGADVALARRLGLDAVPAVFVNGRRVPLPVTIDQVMAQVELELHNAPTAVSPPERPTALPLVLDAVVVGVRPGLGLARIVGRENGARPRVVREGERITPNTLLRRVSERGAQLQVDGRLETLGFARGGSAGPSPRVASPGAASAAVEAATSPARALPVYLDRELVRERMADRVELESHLAPVPMTVEGYRLLKLRDVPPGSLYELLGLQAGDVVVMVNERAIHEGDNPLWDALDREQEVRVRVMRRGGLAQHYTYRFE